MSRTVVIILNLSVVILSLLVIWIAYLKDTTPNPDVTFYATRTLIVTAAIILLNGMIKLVEIFTPKPEDKLNPEKIKTQLTTEIREGAKNRIAELKEKNADWCEVQEVKETRDQMLIVLDRFLNDITDAFEKGEASTVFQKAKDLLQDKGSAEALAYLKAKSKQRWRLVEDLAGHRKQLDEKILIPLREALFEASILETQFRFDEAEAIYRKVLRVAPSLIKPRNDFAWFLIQRGMVIRPLYGKEKLKEAIKISRETIVISPKKKAPQDWATTQNNLGIALQSQGIRTGGDAGAKLLEQAVTAYREALKVRTLENLPQDWATTQNNLGIALLNQGIRTGGDAGAKLLEQAVTAYHEVLKVYTFESLPQGWATTQNNLGNALHEQGIRTDGDTGAKLLEQAVTAYREALKVYTFENLPQDWAMTQNNLGSALQKQGIRTGGVAGATLLEQAVTAYREALKVYTLESLPQGWATTQNNLGSALQEQGILTGGDTGAKLLEQAVTAYHEVLEVYTLESLPQVWGMTQNNLGSALKAQGIRTGGDAGAKLLAQAVTAYREALKVYTPESLPQQWATTQNSLGKALIELGRAERKVELLHEANAVFRSCYSFYKELGDSRHNNYFDKKIEEIEQSIKNLR